MKCSTAFTAPPRIVKCFVCKSKRTWRKSKNFWFRSFLSMALCSINKKRPSAKCGMETTAESLFLIRISHKNEPMSSGCVDIFGPVLPLSGFWRAIHPPAPSCQPKKWNRIRLIGSGKNRPRQPVGGNILLRLRARPRCALMHFAPACHSVSYRAYSTGEI